MCHPQTKDATQPFLHYFSTPPKNQLKARCPPWSISSYSDPTKSREDNISLCLKQRVKLKKPEGAPLIKTENCTVQIQNAISPQNHFSLTDTTKNLDSHDHMPSLDPICTTSQEPLI